jgi:hypothetical protein
MTRLEDDAATIRGLVFISDGSRGADKVAEALRQRDRYSAALDAVLGLAEDWRYKGEFGWGPWQEGYGPDLEGAVLDEASVTIRKVITAALEGEL